MNADAPTPRFPDTRWTLVRASRAGDTRGDEAMEELCRSYWYPLYAHARSRGCSPEDAEDVTQIFFSRMLRRETIGTLSDSAGRLRSYFISSLNNLIAQDWRRRRTQKRGGGRVAVSIDQAAGEARLARELVHHEDPVQLFDRRWALTLLEAVMTELEAEYLRQGIHQDFQWLAPFLGGPGCHGTTLQTYAAAAVRAGTTEGNLRLKVFRLRKRYRNLLCRRIADTVDSPALVDSEIRALFQALSRP